MLISDWSSVVCSSDLGMRYDSGGRTVPDWVSDILGIAILEGLDVQLSHQKFPGFLLGETAARRASVLSIGQESGHIQAMIARYRDDSNRDAATVRNGERDLEQVRSRLATLEGLDDARSKIDAAAALLESIEVRSRETLEKEAVASRIDRLAQRMARHRRLATALVSLPDRQSVVQGKRVAVRVDLGGCRITKNKRHTQ